MMNGTDYRGSQLHTAEAKALAKSRGAHALRQRAAVTDGKIAALVAQNAGLKEIVATVGCHASRVYAWASREKTRIPQKHVCRPFSAKPVVMPGASLAPPSATAAVSISPNVMKAQAAMFRMLDANFDPEAGRYEPGWDDARVAKESGMSLGMVVAFRREGFGELKSNPELQAIASEVAAVKQMMAELEARLAKATGK